MERHLQRGVGFGGLLVFRKGILAKGRGNRIQLRSRV